MAAWSATQPSVQALILIGSRVRDEGDSVWRADAYSDWDFQIITSTPRLFSRVDWARGLSPLEVCAYAARSARIGGVPKINVVFQSAEADFVILPARALRILKWLLSLGLGRSQPLMRRKLQELAVIIRPGWRFLKGSEKWESFYRQAIATVPDPRLTNEDIFQLAEGFVCDYVNVNRKIARGEFLSAQRLLHRDLLETNFRLFHEARLRAGKRSFPEVRRIERIADPEEIAPLGIEDKLDETNLQAAVDKAGDSCRSLVKELIGELWKWPLVGRK